VHVPSPPDPCRLQQQLRCVSERSKHTPVDDLEIPRVAERPKASATRRLSTGETRSVDAEMVMGEGWVSRVLNNELESIMRWEEVCIYSMYLCI
jgi:hypothetical protein